jgi:hypothetical protein
VAYVAGGIGVVGLATFGIFGLLNSSTYSDLQSSCPNNVCPPGKAEDISNGRTQQTIANVGLIVGAVGLVAGVTLFVLGTPKKKAPEAAFILGPDGFFVRGAL